MIEDAESLLRTLRWQEDMLVTNHDGERVWLKPAFNEKNIRIGITDCCPAESPCEWHLAIAERNAP